MGSETTESHPTVSTGAKDDKGKGKRRSNPKRVTFALIFMFILVVVAGVAGVGLVLMYVNARKEGVRYPLAYV